MHNSSKRKLLLFFVLAAAGVAFDPGGAPADETRPEFRVIVNAENTTASLTRSDVSKLMLKEATRWHDGRAARPVDLDPSSPVREAFSRVVLGRSTKTVVSYWQRQVFAGQAVPPPTVSSDDKVVAYVRRHPGGIGYVPKATRLDGVRELTVVGP